MHCERNKLRVFDDAWNCSGLRMSILGAIPRVNLKKSPIFFAVPPRLIGWLSRRLSELSIAMHPAMCESEANISECDRNGHE